MRGAGEVVTSVGRRFCEAVSVHSHSHSGPVRLGRTPTRVRVGLALLLLPLLAATVLGLVWLWPAGDVEYDLPGTVSAHARGTVVEVNPCDNDVPDCVVGLVDVESGEGSPGRVPAFLPFGKQAPEVREGDRIVMTYVEQAPPQERYSFQSFDRTRPLGLLLGLFVAGVLLLSRARGLGSLASLGLSLVMLVTFTLPALSEGAAPLPVAMVTAASIMAVTLYLSHGFTTQTTVAMVGTLFALAATGLLGSLFTRLGRFTGLGDEGGQYIAAINTEIQVGGLLLAGLVIGALGVLDDVTVTQTAAVWELADADPDASRAGLFMRGMRIGRSHVASTVNTLALAYVGAMLPLLLVFSTIALPFGVAVSQELVAQEVVRGLVGGIGIVLAVPITTAVAAFVASTTVADRSRPAQPVR
jgi:uncharacterized membrane protein